MDNSSFSFEVGREAVAQSVRWTRGKVELSVGRFDLEAHLYRSGGPDFYSVHKFNLKVYETFTPECFVGILQLMIDAGYGASTSHLSCNDEWNLSEHQSEQAAMVLVFGVLGRECRGFVPGSTTEDLCEELKRISFLERIGAATCSDWKGDI